MSTSCVSKRTLAEQKLPTSQLLSHKFVQQHVEILMNAASPAVAARNTGFLSSRYCFSRERAYLAHIAVTEVDQWGWKYVGKSGATVAHSIGVKGAMG